MEEKIEQCLEMVRPRLAMHGGNIEFVSWDPEKKAVHVRFTGGCEGCAFSQITLKMGVEAMIREWLPEVLEVVAVEPAKTHG